jgi:hypothetical protein
MTKHKHQTVTIPALNGERNSYTDDEDFVFAVGRLRMLSPLRQCLALYCAQHWSSELFATKLAVIDKAIDAEMARTETLQ